MKRIGPDQWQIGINQTSKRQRSVSSARVIGGGPLPFEFGPREHATGGGGPPGKGTQAYYLDPMTQQQYPTDPVIRQEMGYSTGHIPKGSKR